MNYFELFNLQPGFNIDLTALATRYQQLQQLTHPDKFASAGDQEKRLAVQKNAQVNDGYHTLKQPLSRAEHILALRGVELQDEQQTMQDTAFLMQQMEWREQLADIPHGADPLDELESLDKEVKQETRSRLSGLSEQLSHPDPASSARAADEIRRLKFLYKLTDEIAQLEEKLEDLD